MIGGVGWDGMVFRVFWEEDDNRQTWLDTDTLYPVYTLDFSNNDNTSSNAPHLHPACSYIY